MKYPKPKNSVNPLLRKHLNADALFKAFHTDFSKVADFRQGDVKISMADALMSGFAMFSLKDPALLAFDHPSQGSTFTFFCSQLAWQLKHEAFWDLFCALRPAS